VRGLKGKTYLEKCAELGIETLEDRRRSQDMVLVHKFLTEKTGTELFQRKASQHRTRQMAGGLGLSVRYSRTDPRKYSFAMRTVEPWNNLPESVKEAPSGEAFRSRLKRL
jgi:hypothetical protein